MSYDTVLAERVRGLLAKRPGVVEKPMFGGLAFMLEGRMCCGVLKDDLVVRLDQQRYDEALWEPHVRAMDFTGRPMVGYVYVAPPGVQTGEALQRWLDAAARFVTSLGPPSAGATRGNRKSLEPAKRRATASTAKATAKKNASAAKPAAKKAAAKSKPRPSAKKATPRKAAAKASKTRRRP